MSDLEHRLRALCNSFAGNYDIRLLAGEAADRIKADAARLAAVEAECADLIAGQEYQAMQRTLGDVNARLAEAEHLILRMAGEDYQRARFYVEKYDLTGERAADSAEGGPK